MNTDEGFATWWDAKKPEPISRFGLARAWDLRALALDAWNAARRVPQIPNANHEASASSVEPLGNSSPPVASLQEEVENQTKRGDGWRIVADSLAEEVEQLRKALEEISEGSGPYKIDPLEHAESVINNMTQTARAALKGDKQP